MVDNWFVYSRTESCFLIDKHPCKWGSSGATDVLGVSIGEFNKVEDME